MCRFLRFRKLLLPFSVAICIFDNVSVIFSKTGSTVVKSLVSERMEFAVDGKIGSVADESETLVMSGGMLLHIVCVSCAK